MSLQPLPPDKDLALPEQRLVSMRGYYSLVRARANLEIRKRFKRWREVIKFVAGFGVGMFFGFLWLDYKEVKAQFVATLVFGFAAAVVVWLGEAIYDFINAPVLIHEDAEQKIKGLTDEKRLLIEVKATLEAASKEDAKRIRDEVNNNANTYQYLDTVKSELRALAVERDSLKAQLEELTEYKLTLKVILTSSNVFAEKHSTWNCPVVHAHIGLQFKNAVAQDTAIEDLTVTFCERDADNNMRELPLRGSKPTTLRRYTSKSHGSWLSEPIAGLVVKGHDLSPEYTYVDEDMTIADVAPLTLTNGRHFLRLTLTPVVPQKPYMVDIEVDCGLIHSLSNACHGLDSVRKVGSIPSS